MDEKILLPVFDELFQFLETAETQSAAILQFLKATGIVTEEDLAPHLEQASKASSVRGVAARARINRLLSAAAKSPEKVAEKEPAKPEPKDAAKPSTQDSNPTETNSKPAADAAPTPIHEARGKDTQHPNKAADNAKPAGDAANKKGQAGTD
ncbi:MAG: hypothetical protein WB562_04970 [Candidatus Sulfotelmatobacter sp.]